MQARAREGSKNKLIFQIFFLGPYFSFVVIIQLEDRAVM
jgi:hypothetical protein